MKNHSHKDDLEHYFHRAFESHEDAPALDVWNSLEDRLVTFNAQQKVKNAKKLQNRLLLGVPILLALIWLVSSSIIVDQTAQKDTVQLLHSHNFDVFNLQEESITPTLDHTSNSDPILPFELTDDNITQPTHHSKYLDLTLSSPTLIDDDTQAKGNEPIIESNSIKTSNAFGSKLTSSTSDVLTTYNGMTYLRNTDQQIAEIVSSLNTIEANLVEESIRLDLDFGTESQDDAIDLPKLKSSRFSMELGLTPINSFRTLKADKDFTDSEQEVRFFNQAEQAQLSMAFDLRLNYHIGQNWFIQSGLNLNQWQQKGQYEHKVVNNGTNSFSAILQSSYGVKNIDFDLASNSINTEDELLDMNWTYQEKVLFAEIPLQLGYQIGNGPLRLHVSAGASMALPVHRQVDIKESNLSITNVNTTFTEKYQKSHLNALANLGVSYQIMPKLAFQTSALYQKAVTTIIDNKSYALYPNGYGLRMSLKYCF